MRLRIDGRHFLQTSLVALALALVAGACGGGDPATDAATPRADANGDDAGARAEANIQEALACGMPLGVSGTAAAGELQLHQVDTARFPDALCNDGTPAVLYYRPYRGEENRDRWAITLRGGGTCGSAETCAARWCSCAAGRPCEHTDVVTNFTLDNMSGGGRRGNAGNGIHSRDLAHASPIADYNHVQLVYCSSDGWRGNARGVSFTTTHPRRGDEVTFTMHFLGARILAADLAILRQDGAPALRYTLDGEAVEMPDLDDATDVIIAGDSAGGAGTIVHLDAIAEQLRAHHTGAGEGPRVVGLIDAIVGPALDRLDFSRTAGADMGIDTYPEAMDALATSVVDATAFKDESCVAYHASRGDASVCADDSHVLRHHVTTPFFVRMALLDDLISRIYQDARLEDPELGPFDRNDVGVPVTFGVVLQRELEAFPMLPESAEEGDAMTVAPGVFAPACSNHDTIHEDTEVYGVTIDPGSGPLHLFDVLEPWRAGGTPTAAVTTDPMRLDTVCPPRAP